MSREQVRRIVESRIQEDGMIETGIAGVKLFRATEPVPCAPVVYEPSVTVIVSGSKEAALDGRRHVYDDRQYICCPTSLPIEAGTPTASKDNPLMGVYIALDPRVMTELTVEMDTVAAPAPLAKRSLNAQGIGLACWDDEFADALLRLLQSSENRIDLAVLGRSRLREFYYAVLKGEAGLFARQAFGVGNAIARSIQHISSKLGQPVSIDELAARAGMSRAVFHRKFKTATTMAPIQFVKSMRLNSAALKIAGGMSVGEAAIQVGYASSSQFSREFKRLYGKSPRQWSAAETGYTGAI